MPDERVACPSIGEDGGATLGEASVVDEPCPHESLERFRAHLRCDTALRELAVDLRGAPVTMAQEAKRGLDSSRPSPRVPGQLSTGTASSRSTSTTASFGACAGRSRAEITWSSEASAWIRERICWTRSGFSERKLVAF